MVRAAEFLLTMFFEVATTLRLNPSQAALGMRRGWSSPKFDATQAAPNSSRWSTIVRQSHGANL
jgi:hypothetical protein